MSSYWKKRRKVEQEYIEETFKYDEEFLTVVNDYYDQALFDIEETIAKEYARLSQRNHESINLTKEQVSKMDVQQYSKEAKKIVEAAEKKIKSGKHVSFKDYSDEVNKHLRLYNATMRINRLELLKSEIGLYLTQANLNVDASLRIKLEGDYLKEVRRQAGILGETVPKGLKRNEAIFRAVYASMENNDVTFSTRLWANMDALKSNLDAMLSSGLVRGKSYQYIAKQLRDAMNGMKYACERIVRTEGSRILYNAQYESFKQYGYDYVRYMAEPKACQLCSKLSKADNGYDELGVYRLTKAPKIPDDTHPNCRCTIVAHWIDKVPEKDKKALKAEEAKIKQAKQTERETFSNLKKFKKAILDLGFQQFKGKGTGIEAKDFEIIYNTVANEFKKHPELRGYMRKFSIIDLEKSGALAGVRISQKRKGNSYDTWSDLEINRTFLNGTNKSMFGKSMAEVVKSEAESGWWVKHKDYSGVIKHEMGHALSNKISMAEAIGTTENRLLNVLEAKKQFVSLKTQAVPREVIEETFYRMGLETSAENLQKYISGYAKTSANEAFAEAYAMEEDTKFKRTFDEVLNERIKGAFKK